MKATQSIQGVPIPSCDTGNSVVRSPEDNVERIGVLPIQSARKRRYGEGTLNCYRIVKRNWRKRLTRRHQKVRSPVSAALVMLKRMDIVLPVYRQLLKRHNYPDYGTWKPQYAPEKQVGIT